MGKVFFRPNRISESIGKDRQPIILPDKPDSIDMDIATYQRLESALPKIQYLLDELRNNPELLNKLTAFEQDMFFTKLRDVESLLRKIVKI